MPKKNATGGVGESYNNRATTLFTGKEKIITQITINYIVTKIFNMNSEMHTNTCEIPCYQLMINILTLLYSM